MRRALTLVALLALNCGPKLPAAYVQARSDAEQAYSARKYEKSAELWLKAAAATERRRDKVEARFRAAASYERAGRVAEARRLYAELERDPEPNERAARATFALAELEISHGNEDRGYEALQAAALKYPSSGLARGAFLRYVEWLKTKRSVEASLAYIAGMVDKVRDSELHQTALLVRAKLLGELGKRGEAEKAYLELAALYPYPRGSYWDDALIAAAELQESRGDYAGAVATLNRLLAEREVSYISGSYERSRYAQAQFHIAELYRDHFRDLPRARQAFRRTFNDYPTSTLRDDALWQEALVAKHLDDAAGMCTSLRLLVEQLPESRFAACAPSLCTELKAPPKNQRCHDYILREAEAPQPRTAPHED